MADLGTVTLVDVTEVSPATGYALAGTVQTTPTAPTTGQIWPRGQGT